jgi:DNA modification methylase
MAKRPKTSTRAESTRPDPFGNKALSFLETQTIFCGDNLEKLRQMPDACVDLIYIDPPFNSNRNYEVSWGKTKETRAFDDRYASTEAYIDFMRPRCVQLARILKSTGSFYYHCDWHASHYVKVELLDRIFGENSFQNEIVWKRSGAHSDTKQGMSRYGRLFDSIFFYTCGRTWTWNPQYQPYDATYLREKFRQQDEDGRRWNSVTLTAAKAGGKTEYEWRGVRPPKGRYWAYTRENLERLEAEGRIHFTRTGTPRLKQYLDEMSGVPLQNLWTDISPINSQANERIGFPTQKPLPLLERIVRASSNPDDIVLDAFCGCGTAPVAAQKLSRRWIGIDISPIACRVMAKRLEEECGLREKKDFTVREVP